MPAPKTVSSGERSHTALWGSCVPWGLKGTWKPKSPHKHNKHKRFLERPDFSLIPPQNKNSRSSCLSMFMSFLGLLDTCMQVLHGARAGLNLGPGLSPMVPVGCKKSGASFEVPGVVR